MGALAMVSALLAVLLRTASGQDGAGASAATNLLLPGVRTLSIQTPGAERQLLRSQTTTISADDEDEAAGRSQTTTISAVDEDEALAAADKSKTSDSPGSLVDDAARRLQRTTISADDEDEAAWRSQTTTISAVDEDKALAAADKSKTSDSPGALVDDAAGGAEATSMKKSIPLFPHYYNLSQLIVWDWTFFGWYPGSLWWSDNLWWLLLCIPLSILAFLLMVLSGGMLLWGACEPQRVGGHVIFLHFIIFALCFIMLPWVLKAIWMLVLQWIFLGMLAVPLALWWVLVFLFNLIAYPFLLLGPPIMASLSELWRRIMASSSELWRHIMASLSELWRHIMASLSELWRHIMASWSELSRQIMAYWSERHSRSVTSGVPYFVAVPVAALLFLVPTVTMCCVEGHIGWKFEVVASSGDLGSDLLWALTSKFWSRDFMVMAFCITFGSGIVTVLWLFGMDIIQNHVMPLAMWPCRRLAKNGLHQVFASGGVTFETHAVNFLAMLALCMLVLVMPLIGVLWMIIIVLIGALLQSMKLLSLRRWDSRFKNFCCEKVGCGIFEIKNEDEIRNEDDIDEGLITPAQGLQRADNEAPAGGDSLPVNLKAYNLGIILELILEVVPAIVLNTVNSALVQRDHLDKVGWTSWLALAFSAYMGFRVGFKYLFSVCHLKSHCLEVGAPNLEEDKDSLGDAKLGAAGAAGVAGAFGAAAVRNVV